MGTADLHTHTSLSDGMMDVGALLEHVQEQTSLDVLAVTDHDDIAAGILAQELVRERGYRFQVVIGAEITTLEGHLLGLFLQHKVAPFQSLAATLKAIHLQSGLAIVPHPMSWLTFSVGQRSIDRVMNANKAGVYLDGIEIENPTIAGKLTREKVQRLNRERYHLAVVGGSDAHFLAAVGSGYARFPGHTADELRQAILEKQTEAISTEIDLKRIGYGALVKQQVRSLVVQPTRAVSRPLLKFLRGT